MLRRLILAASIGAMCAATVVAQPPPPAGQRGQGAGRGPQPARNLQVLPKDTPRPALTQIMREYTAALGVRCDHCHKRVEGQPQPVFDADDKIEKQKAREMIKMVTAINDTMLAALPGRTAGAAKVECVTCHRGLPVPRTLNAILTETIEKSGVDAAVKQYRDLREKDLATGRYNFGEATLTDTARVQAEKTNLDAAIKLAELNAEFYPKSGVIDFQIGEFYLQKGDKDQALARYKMAVEKAPDNNRAKTRIGELEKK